MKKLSVIPNWALERWLKVAYLIINWNVKDLGREIHMDPERGFYTVAAKYLNNYLQNDEMPPKEIEGAILNMADEHLAGEGMKIRAGDYIAIQNFIRKNREVVK